MTSLPAKVAVLGLLIATACARVSGPVEIPPEELPFAVSRDATPTDEPGAVQTVIIYLVRDGLLFPVSRRVGTDVSAPEAALRTLILGPTGAELRRGLQTELPASVRLLGFALADATAFVDLSGEFQEPATPEQIVLRVAQVVWTLTEFPEISAVLFAIDGETVAVTTPGQMVVNRPVTRGDYGTLGAATN